MQWNRAECGWLRKQSTARNSRNLTHALNISQILVLCRASSGLFIVGPREERETIFFFPYQFGLSNAPSETFRKGVVVELNAVVQEKTEEKKSKD